MLSKRRPGAEMSRKPSGPSWTAVASLVVSLCGAVYSWGVLSERVENARSEIAAMKTERGEAGKVQVEMLTHLASIDERLKFLQVPRLQARR